MTVGDLVTRALQLAGVVGMNRAPSAAEMNDGIDTLNEMLQSAAIGGMDLGLPTLVQSDTVNTDAAFIKGIRYNLAVELAGAHGILNELPPIVIQTAAAEQDKIREQLTTISDLRCDRSLLKRSTGYDFTDGN
jgi:hypothetical protein